MSIEKTPTRILRPHLSNEPTGPVLKSARPQARLVADLIDLGLLIFLVMHTSEHFETIKLLPKMLARHNFFIIIFYYYFVLTILPQHFFGQSIGQLLTGLRLITTSHDKPSFFTIFARSLLRPTTLVFPMPVLMKNTKAWYDNLLKTMIAEFR